MDSAAASRWQQRSNLHPARLNTEVSNCPRLRVSFSTTSSLLLRARPFPYSFRTSATAVAEELMAGHHSTGKPGEVAPATLPDTPQNFPISESKLIDIAKKLYAEDTGTKNPNALAPAFRLEFPIVSMGKKEYLKAVGTFNLDEAFPNMASHPYHWRVDPYEPNRVWFTIRNTATHSGPLKFFSKTFKPTGKQVLGAPECLSYTFDSEGRCTSFTGGYIMDRRVGNTKKMGAMFGILAAIGGPIPEPETIPYALFIISNRLPAIFKAIVRTLTLGVIFGKPKQQ